MNGNMIMALIGALVATSATIASALVFVISSSKAAGRREGKLDEALKSIKKVQNQLDDIPQLKLQLGQHETLIETIRSDIRGLKGHPTQPGVDIHFRPKAQSSPKFDNDDEDEK